MVTARLHRYIWIISLVALGCGMMLSVQAAETCDCYCNIEGQGATQYPNVDTRITREQCEDTCAEEGYSVVVCAYKPEQKPEFNFLCLTEDECAIQGGVQTATGTGTPTQPGECKAGMYYCYPNPKNRIKAQLQVEIAGLTVTGDLGEYISSVYLWMVGAGTTLAIVFVMIGGLQWSFGGVSAEQIGKAKKLMSNAIVGLVLLMSTYLIISTVNPYLVRLQVPAFPLIKSVQVVKGESCGYLTGVWGSTRYLQENGAPSDSPYQMNKGYTVENGEGTACGSVWEVTKAPEGKTVAEDQTCTYDYCPDGKDRCISGSGKGNCLSCEDFGYGGDAPVEPTPEICASFEKTLNKTVEKCTYYNPTTLTEQALEAITGLEIGEKIGTPFCIYESENCSGKSCSSFGNEADCSGNICGLACIWKETSTSTSSKTAEAFDLGTCLPR